MARLESQDNPRIVQALLAGKLLTFSSLAAATGIPTTTLDRRLKSLMEAGIVSYYEFAGSYGLSLWLRTENLGFKTALQIMKDSESTKNPFKIFTIGYEGRTPESFVKILESNGIRRLIDVREIANSRKAGFSASVLSNFLGRYGIEYIHLKSLGSPRDARKKLHSDNDFSSFSKEYESFLNGKKEDLRTLIGLAVERPTAIMCFENDASHCHRSIIASRIISMGFGIQNL